MLKLRDGNRLTLLCHLHCLLQLPWGKLSLKLTHGLSCKLLARWSVCEAWGRAA